MQKENELERIGYGFFLNEVTGMLEADPWSLGTDISECCENAVVIANRKATPVRFTFNETEIIARPGETPAAVESRWSTDMTAAHEAYINSDEYKERQKRNEEELARKTSASMKESAKTEAEMRAAESPWPYTLAQLTEYIESLVSRDHDYGTCVYAMSLAATAAFNYVAHELGTTGFQSSCADLDVIRRTRSIKGPFIILKGEDALYPQYDLRSKLNDALKEWQPWLNEQAAEKLKDVDSAHPDVIRHWKNLAEGRG